jgi:hypothetical protein
VVHTETRHEAAAPATLRPRQERATPRKGAISWTHTETRHEAAVLAALDLVGMVALPVIALLGLAFIAPWSSRPSGRRS